MNHCAFLSMDNLDNFECYDHLLFDPLRKNGWKVEEISWRTANVNWSRFDVVVIRSPWDYQQAPTAFLNTLRTIHQSPAHLENSLQLVEWNIDKTYLRDLQNKGVEIVPTQWHQQFDKRLLVNAFEQFSTDEIIIKPTVSANADDTFRIQHDEQQTYHKKLSAIFDDRPFLIQPFMNNIVAEGEFSVFFFDETYSHTILKTPGAEDFRVQEEHGGTLQLVEEPADKLIQSARKLLNALPSTPLYSRMDYVRTQQDTFALMELELIEPSLYFNMDSESPELFANVFDERMSEQVSD